MSWWIEFAPGFVVVLLLVVCLLVLRRKGLARFRLPGLDRSSHSDAQVKVLETRPLSAQHTLYLVQVGKLKMLLSGAPASCQLVAILPDSSASQSRPQTPEARA